MSTTTNTEVQILHQGDLAVQTRIRLPLPLVKGNRDYNEKEALLRRMDEILVQSGIEAEFINREVAAAREERGRGALTDRQAATVHHHAAQKLRCTIARILSNESHRKFSVHLAESPLLQWFCRCENLGEVRVPSKSALQRMEASVPQGTLDQLNADLLHQASVRDDEGNPALGLAEAVDLSLVWMDATCAKLDIHYPADWTLLRDGTRSIMRAITVIRRYGLRHRMCPPETFVASMNRHAMAMSSASRRGRGGDKKKSRKRTLRAMKLIAKKVMSHGQRYRDLLANRWNETDLSQAEADLILARLDNLLNQMPAAIRQAHERIIGERLVPNEEKILSLYQPHARVYVRGKAGADAEFGLQMLLTESAEGLIIDCHLVPDGVANDSTLLIPAITRMRARHGQGVARAVVTDRGFASQANSQTLATMGVTDATLPRDPEKMRQFLDDPALRELQCRRAQTEARIGIFKANFVGDHLPTKSLLHQQRFVAWAALAHNLWVLARLPIRSAATRQPNVA